MTMTPELLAESAKGWGKHNTMNYTLEHLSPRQSPGLFLVMIRDQEKNDACLIRYRLHGRDEKQALKEALEFAAPCLPGGIESSTVPYMAV